MAIMPKCVVFAWLAAIATGTSAPPKHPVWVRIDKLYTSEHGGSDAVLLKGVSHKITGTAYGPTDAVDVWLDGKLVAHVPVTGTKGNMTHWPVWQAKLPPMPAGFGHTVNVTTNSTSGYNASTGINFGTVLLCSGQSNMALKVGPCHFDADNGTAESLASSRYTGKISLMSSYTLKWQNVSNATLPEFSAVCWYTGKAYYERFMDETEPLGLMMGYASGTPIEYWVRDEADVAGCGNITGRCWNATRVKDRFGRWTGLAHLYNNLIKPFATAGLGVSAIVWDQAEADVGCHTEQFPTPPLLGGDPAYECLQKAMIEGWRGDFGPLSSDPNPNPNTNPNPTLSSGPRATAPAPPPIPWVGVQLPGYGNPKQTGMQRNNLFQMRLAQARGADDSLKAAEIVPTYDLSCPECPWGSIHPTDKQDVGSRLAARLGSLLHNDAAKATKGPKAVSATVSRGGSNNTTEVSIVFATRAGAEPIRLIPTRNCTRCCTSGSDFDVSVDGGVKWVAGTGPPEVTGDDTVKFEVSLPQGLVPATTVLVRYTATQIFPQCAVSDGDKLPAYPFQLRATTVLL